MAERIPLVQIGGQIQQLPAADTLAGTSGGGVQLGGADASQTLIMSLNGGASVQPNDVVAVGGTPTSAGV